MDADDDNDVMVAILSMLLLSLLLSLCYASAPYVSLLLFNLYTTTTTAVTIDTTLSSSSVQRHRQTGSRIDNFGTIVQVNSKRTYDCGLTLNTSSKRAFSSGASTSSSTIASPNASSTSTTSNNTISDQKQQQQQQTHATTTSTAYIGYKDKKILIHGNDVGGVSLALFLKKKGISSELIETKPIISSASSSSAISCYTPTFQSLDRGYFISFSNASILKKYGVFDNIHRKGFNINNQLTVSRDGDKYGSLAYEKCSPSDSPIRLPFTMTESALIESLLSECLQTPQLGEGTVRIRKQKIRSIEQQPQQQQNNNNKDGKALVSFMDTGSRIGYDLVVGADPFDYHHSHTVNANTPPNTTVSHIRQYILNRVPQTKESYTLYQFSTIANRPPVFPAMVLRQFAKDKRMLAFPLPNERVAISGAFIRPPNTAQDPDNGRNKVYHTMCDFEDLGAHTVVALQDSAPENMKLERFDPIRLKDFVSGNIALMGEAADKFTLGSIESYSAAIEDANELAEILSTSNPNQIEQSLARYNQQRQTRLSTIANAILEQDTFTFKGGWKITMLGTLYLKYFFAQFNQSKLVK
ncbi:hypothetical protein DFA_08393 [Cavenderia fasciculata]|uniref:FAD-binding domain-containing protein n=1 Tax=Cavenderia fasciculata TaxID=261658 RepID=F4Q5Y9_CACFS|nr:uncharacterized protein DFA_08393 [Cavenderia fasciculata]EGG17398.1 hypothetical protein DFA_08393 [Cavenderia fasciculata]|eukprot:XP_004355882.1 hypothetical protein DFA_08393 [Cavenderia fasciculata]